MNKLLGAVLTVALIAAAVTAQDMTQVFTRPVVPPREALDRLHLKVGWQVQLPMDGTRDGIYSLQMAGGQVLIQTRSGLITLLDRDTGQTLWRTRVGNPYAASHPLAHNVRSVIVAQGTWLYALDRTTGQLQWQFNLPDATAAGPAADDDQIYLALGSGHLVVHQLPPVSRRKVTETALNKNYIPKVEDPLARPPEFHRGSTGTTSGIGPLASAVAAGRTEGSGPRPALQWNFQAGMRLDQAPILGTYEMLWPGATGTALVLGKRNDLPFRPYRFPTDGPISARPGQHGDIAYLASHDGNLYALHIPSGRTLWRLAGGNPIWQRPAVTNDDVYVAPQGSGLYRLDRAGGQTVWRNPAAQRFLAANPKFVYAADRNNRLLVLDRARGTQLSAYDGTRGFVVPVSNEQTDRIFLAAHDGQLVCLHDRDYATPVSMKDDDEKLTAPERRPGILTPGKPDDKKIEKPDDKVPEKPDGKMEKPGEGMDKKEP